MLANLQANTVYWRECAEELEQNQQKEKANEANAPATNAQNTTSANSNSSCNSLPRTKSIVEDNEVENE